MKKFFWMTALASVALAGCVSEEVAEMEKAQKGKLLTFGAPVMYNQSRAVGEIGTTYPTDESFVVFGIEHDGLFAGWGENEIETDNERYFPEAGLVVNNRTGTNHWDTDDNYYLPTSDGTNDPKLSFAAYSPSRAKEHAANVSFGEAGLTINSWTMQNSPSMMYDLMYSNVSANITQAEVPIKFYHALSSVCLSFSKPSMADNNKANSPVQVLLKKVAIGGRIHNKGTFNQNLTGGSDFQGNPAWEATLERTGDAPDDYILYEGDDIEIPEQDKNHILIGGANNTLGNDFLPIPQAVNSNMYVKISYSIKQDDGDTPIIENDVIIPFTKFIHTDGVSVTKSWLMSTRYVYHIHFGALAKIFFTPVVEGTWKSVDNGNSGVYTITNNSTSTPG